MLVTRREQLQGISNKKELQATKDDIKLVSKELKASTFKLGRQLHDNPDTAGNMALVQSHRREIMNKMHDVMEEMRDQNQYVEFKNEIDKEKEEISRFDKLKKEEKLYTDEIK